MAADGMREGIEVLRALSVYRGSVLPRARRWIRRWEVRAEAIPEPRLRRHALDSLREKGLNVEATAVFAILAPRRGRPAAVAAMAALQVAVDYLDTLGEQPSDDPLGEGLRLHGALADALSPGAPAGGWYGDPPAGEDGGYLAELVATCREAVARLPGAAAALPAARRAAGRCGAGQSHTHAAALGEAEGLRRWAELEGAEGYRWWEAAAGASSSAAAQALIGAAAEPGLTAAEAARVDAAYFPAIGALTVLLDDLVDRDEDLAAGAHNYIAHYASPEEAAARLGLIAARARALTAALPRGGAHAAILAGVAGFYLSAPGARRPFARPAAAALQAELGPAVRLIAASMRSRRRMAF